MSIRGYNSLTHPPSPPCPARSTFVFTDSFDITGGIILYVYEYLHFSRQEKDIFALRHKVRFAPSIMPCQKKKILL